MSNNKTPSESDQYMNNLLEDIRAVVENHQGENSRLCKMLTNLLNRPDGSGEQPFKIHKQ